MVTDREHLPERLRNTPRDEAYETRVKWAGMIIGLHGGKSYAIEALFRKDPDALLEAGLQEDLGHCAQLAYLYSGEDHESIVRRVLDSPEIHAWKNLAVACPELAMSIQDELVFLWEQGDAIYKLRGLDARFLISFLEEVKDTSPLSILNCLAPKHIGLVIDLVIRFPNRVLLFTVVDLLLHKTEEPIGMHAKRLCAARPDAASILEMNLLNMHGAFRANNPERICQVCSEKIPGMDLDKIEEWCISNFSASNQRLFCSVVKRDRGPLRDLLTVEYVMET